MDLLPVAVSADGVCLPCSGLPVSQDSAVEPPEEPLHKGLHAFREEGGAGGRSVPVSIDIVKGKAAEVVTHHRHLVAHPADRA